MILVVVNRPCTGRIGPVRRLEGYTQAKLILPGCLPGYRTRPRLELALYRFTGNM